MNHGLYNIEDTNRVNIYEICFLSNERWMLPVKTSIVYLKNMTICYTI